MHIFLWCYLWLCTFSTKWNALIYSFGPSVRYFISQKLKTISEPNFLHLVEQSSNRCTMILLNPLGAVGLTAILLNLVDFWHVNIKLSRYLLGDRQAIIVYTLYVIVSFWYFYLLHLSMFETWQIARIFKLFTPSINFGT